MNEDAFSQTFKNRVDLRLRRIADVLLLNGSITDDPGLLNGKLGIALFFYIYARYSGNKAFDDHAGELIDDIYKYINSQVPVNFSNGLTGIGWGIEYLVRNGYVQADTDDTLQEIDVAIYQSMLQRPVLMDNGDDLFSYGFYYLARLQGREEDDDNLNTLIKKQQLIHLTDECDRLMILKKYLDFNIKSLGMGIINSIAWFLLEMNKSGLFPSKIRRLLQHVPSELEFTSKTIYNPVEEYVLCSLIQNIIPLVDDIEVQNKYKSFSDVAAERWREMNPDNEMLLDIISSLAWHKLTYAPYVKNDKVSDELTNKMFNIIDDENYWSSHLDKLNKDNMGLKGLAGLGLGLMNLGSGTA